MQRPPRANPAPGPQMVTTREGLGCLLRQPDPTRNLQKVLDSKWKAQPYDCWPCHAKQQPSTLVKRPCDTKTHGMRQSRTGSNTRGPPWDRRRLHLHTFPSCGQSRCYFHCHPAGPCQSRHEASRSGFSSVSRPCHPHSGALEDQPSDPCPTPSSDQPSLVEASSAAYPASRDFQ